MLSRLAFSARHGFVTALMRSPLVNGGILCVGNTPRVMLKGYGRMVLSNGQISAIRCHSAMRRRLLNCRGVTVHALKFTFGVISSGTPGSYIRLITTGSLGFLKIITVSSPVHPSIPTTIRGYRSTNVNVGVMANSAPNATARVTHRVKL